MHSDVSSLPTPRHRTVSATLVLAASLLFAGSRLAIPVSAVEVPGDLRISEVMYHPVDGDAYEFLEIQNVSVNPVNLGGLHFEGITFTFPQGRTLAAGGLMVLVSDASPSAFTNRYPAVAIAGVYSGRLSNGGERIALLDAQGRTLESVTYGDDSPWPNEADGLGYSLERIILTSAANDPANWRASLRPGGSPGVANEPVVSGAVRFNEIMAENVSAVPNGNTFPDWIELHNTGTGEVNLSGWSFSDDTETPRRFVFPEGVNLAAQGYLVVWCDAATNATPGLHAGLALKREGETVLLFDAATNRVDAFTFGPQVRNYSLGFVGTDWALNIPSPGAANQAASVAAVSNVKINEWLANAAPLESDWLELHNTNPNLAAALGGGSIVMNERSVKIFPHTFVGPGGFLRLWADEKAGTDHLDLKLPASGGTLRLLDVGGAEADRVVFEAQSEGLSEGRVPDGADTIVSLTGGASPGQSNRSDTDGDGLPDVWERDNGFDLANASDAASDADGDGLSNLDEYLIGTDPRNRQSDLRLMAVRESGQLILSFNAQPSRSYSLLRSASTGPTDWQKVADFQPSVTEVGRSIAIAMESVSSGAFFEVVSPQRSLPGDPGLAEVNPLKGATNVAANTRIEIYFRSPLDPGAITSNTVVVTLSSRSVTGRLSLSEENRKLTFSPALPLLHETPYVVALAAVRGTNGALLAEAAEWSFKTAAAPDLVDNRAVYQQDDPTAVRTVRLTLFERVGGFTFDDLLNDTDSSDDFKPKVEVLFQEGAFGAGDSFPNGVLQVRGDSVRYTDQKSWRVELAPVWNGYQTVNLNKHPYDLTRVRNKLSFDLLTTIPHLNSLRTAFVNLFIDDEDYGLFTQVENPGDSFLQAHGFETGHLYKTEFFEFFRYPDELRLRTDPAYNEQTFETILEIKGSREHAKLLAMLDEVNDSDLDINEVVRRHFNRENYLSWLAFNILLENIDTSSRNFYLYSPASQGAWYFVPWDYDGAWGFYDQPNQQLVPIRARWQNGLANYWGTPLHRRFLSDSANRRDLEARMVELKDGPLSLAAIDQRLNAYHPVVRPFIAREPDISALPSVPGTPKPGQFDAEYARIRDGVVRNHTSYLATLGRPMPFFLGEPEKGPEGWAFVWDESIDLQGDAITYDFQVSRTKDFSSADIAFAKVGLTGNSLTVTEPLPAGTYFWRVTARETALPDVNWQWPFDSHYDEATGRLSFGMRMFVVE